VDFSYTGSEKAFRDEVRDWLAANLPEGWGETVFEPTDEDERAMFRLDWEKKLYEGGWSGLEWPTEYGGRGATLVEQAIFAEELARARAPEGLNIIQTWHLCGPRQSLTATNSLSMVRRSGPVMLNIRIGALRWCERILTHRNTRDSVSS
jgi:alkylation response protein AidB-like acyl-CoA dehydrogenase